MNDVLSDMVETLQNVTDPWLLFLCVIYHLPHSIFLTQAQSRKGLALSRVGRREEAIEAAILSITGYPWNWSAWTLFMSCIKDGEEVGFAFFKHRRWLTLLLPVGVASAIDPVSIFSPFGPAFPSKVYVRATLP